MKKLYFIRHGLSEMNVQKLISGSTDTILTEEGRRQAKKAGQSAKDLDIHLIVSSPMKRALETARIVAQEIGYPTEKIVLYDQLRERSFGVLEGTPHMKKSRDYTKIEGAETDEALLNRAQAVVDWINKIPDDHVLIVAHGAIGRAIRSHIKEDFPFSHEESLPNAEIICWIEEN